jgi:hypothetical protein
VYRDDIRPGGLGSAVDIANATETVIAAKLIPIFKVRYSGFPVEVVSGKHGQLHLYDRIATLVDREIGFVNVDEQQWGNRRRIGRT